MNFGKKSQGVLAVFVWVCLAGHGNASDGLLAVTGFSGEVVKVFDASTGVLVAEVDETHLKLPAGVVFDANGDLLVMNSGATDRGPVDSAVHMLRFDPLSGTFLGSFSSTSQISHPRGVLRTTNADLLIVNRGANNVIRVDGCSGRFEEIAAAGGGLAAPISVVLGSDGRLFVASKDTNSVIVYDVETGVLVEEFGGLEMDVPVGLVFLPNGRLVVAVQGTDSLLEYDVSQSPTQFVQVFADDGGLDNPVSMIIGPNSNVFVTSAGTGNVKEYDLNGGFVQDFTAPGSVEGAWGLQFGAAPRTLPSVPGFLVDQYAVVPAPFTLSFDASENLYVGRQSFHYSFGTEFISKVDSGSSLANQFGSSMIDDPDAVIVDADGAVTGVVDAVIVGGASPLGGGMGRISYVHPSGQVDQLFESTNFFNPYDFVFDQAGRLLFTDNILDRVLEIDGGQPTLLFSLPTQAACIAIDSDNNIIASDGDGVVRRYDPNGQILADPVIDGLGPSPPIAIGPGTEPWGTDLFVIDTNNGDLLRVDSSGQATAVGYGFCAAARDMEFGPDNALYVSLEKAGRVLKILPCNTGSVNGSEDALAVNGSSGVGLYRAVEIGIGEAITVSLDAAPSGPGGPNDPVARYVVWAWLSPPANAVEFRGGGATLGCLVNPTPFQQGLSPQPFRCVRGTGIPPIVCNGVVEIQASPSRAPWSLTKASGLGVPQIITLQGLLQDNGAGNPTGFSVTNAVTIVVE